MNFVINFLRQYELIIYLILVFTSVFYIIRFIRAWQDLSISRYSLERETGQMRLNRNAIMLFVLLAVGVSVFILVTFLQPTLPLDQILPTQTIQLLDNGDGQLVEAAIDEIATATPLPSLEINSDNCVEGKVQILSPQIGDTVSGIVKIEGTVEIENFGFYKVERARVGENLPVTIQAGRSMIREGVLVESWDTSSLPPGEYILQLIVTESNGTALPACRIPIIIEAVPE
ncbi:MAG: hypothetical protein JXA19_00600 [Anaerolineales bacterium]|nr:hypothetical protein [Anaerolineales bacterium]